MNIGNVDLIDKRRSRQVPIAPEGVLADYVPFYFTPFSVMMQNIHSGWSVQQRTNDEIVILVSSLYRVVELGLPFVFTNAHAYPIGQTTTAIWRILTRSIGLSFNGATSSAILMILAKWSVIRLRR